MPRHRFFVAVDCSRALGRCRRAIIWLASPQLRVSSPVSALGVSASPLLSASAAGLAAPVVAEAPRRPAERRAHPRELPHPFTAPHMNKHAITTLGTAVKSDAAGRQNGHGRAASSGRGAAHCF